MEHQMHTSGSVVTAGKLCWCCNSLCVYRDNWNVLDFVIVVSGFIALVIEHTVDDDQACSSSNLSSIRMLRVLRPLKTINSVPRLQTIVMSLLMSVDALWKTLLLIGTFFVFFAVIGLQVRDRGSSNSGPY